MAIANKTGREEVNTSLSRVFSGLGSSESIRANGIYTPGNPEAPVRPEYLSIICCIRGQSWSMSMYATVVRGHLGPTRSLQSFFIYITDLVRLVIKNEAGGEDVDDYLTD